jgi:prophage regulatory protein
MRIIDWKELKKTVPYSRQHIGRLEVDGQFPQRVQLGHSRVGWVESEVQDWIQQRIDRRRPLTPPDEGE